ncbi:MAG TPA: hypothetical protein VMD30_10720 [Tepidisphaeraceae bacterium]|nr:hypothetical protein [Tepidisphaeraceae bacterium]
MFGKKLSAVLFASVVGLAATHARADAIFAGSGTLQQTSPTGQLGSSLGAPVSASVDFSVTGSTLNVTLTNTLAAGSLNYAEQALDQVVFNLSGTGLSLATANNGDFSSNGSVTSGTLADYSTSGISDVTGTENKDWGGGAFGSTTDSGVKITAGESYDILSLADEETDKSGASFGDFYNDGSLGNTVQNGILPNVVPSSNGNFVGFNPFSVGSVSFALTLINTDDLSPSAILADISNVQFVFDDKDPPTVVIGQPQVSGSPSPAPLPPAAAGCLVLCAGLYAVRKVRRPALWA